MNTVKLKCAVISSISADISALILLLLFSFLTYNSENPASLRSLLGLGTLIFCSLLSGIFPFIYGGEKEIPCSLLSGGFYCLFVLILSSVFGKDGSFLLCLIKIVSVMLCSFLSSLIYIKITANKRKRKKRR